jgi:hypothetical protein
MDVVELQDERAGLDDFGQGFRRRIGIAVADDREVVGHLTRIDARLPAGTRTQINVFQAKVVNARTAGRFRPRFAVARYRAARASKILSSHRRDASWIRSIVSV